MWDIDWTSVNSLEVQIFYNLPTNLILPVSVSHCNYSKISKH